MKNIQPQEEKVHERMKLELSVKNRGDLPWK